MKELELGHWYQDSVHGIKGYATGSYLGQAGNRSTFLEFIDKDGKMKTEQFANSRLSACEAPPHHETMSAKGHDLTNSGVESTTTPTPETVPTG